MTQTAGNITSTSATVNNAGTQETGKITTGTWNGQQLQPAYIPAEALSGGTVTSVALTAPNIFSVAGSPVTTTGTLAVTLATQTANKVWASATSGGAATPAFRALVLADLPSGVVTSVALTAPAEFSVAGSPITGSGTLAVTKATQVANTIWAGPTTGADAQPAFRALVAADIPSAYDTTLVHLAGPETITGIKTFTANPVFNSGAIPVAAITGLAASATTDTTNAANIASGTLANARLSGAYTGVTGLGTLTSLTCSGAITLSSTLYMQFGSAGSAGAFGGLGVNGIFQCTSSASTSTGTNSDGQLRFAIGIDAGASSPTAGVAQSHFCFTSRGAAGTRIVTLPASPFVGLTYFLTAYNSKALQVQANTGQTIQIGTAKSTSAGTATTTTDGATCILMYTVANTWEALGSSGSWTLA